MAVKEKNARRKKKPMVRPKLDKTKDSRIDVTMHTELRETLEKIARREGRTLSQLCERGMRAWAIQYLKDAGEDATTLEELP